ncbi:M64 family metallopeptidase [Billgrantia diversa]|uniref:M64 family metallopeptidase n=1 Tax=Halomonas sp. MCCC 1A13316 TaxID=2733487 RepID=UPI0018D379F4|nr:M64 family metallopeptidase [Halomonas sp. MCCC 1A13316]
MQNIQKHAEYLDRLFSNIWASAHPLIGDRAVHEIARQLPSIASLDNVTRLVVYIKPKVDHLSGGRLEIKLPAPAAFDNQYFEFHLDLNNSITASALARLWAEVDANGAIWHSDVDVDVDTPWWAWVLLGPLATVPFEIIDEVLGSDQENQIIKQLSQLKNVLYDRSVELEPTGVTLDLVHGSFGGNISGADSVDWIDILFIADNYNASNINEFHAAVDVATKKLTKVSGDPSSALFVAHESVLRTWKLPLTQSGTAKTGRLMGSANRPGGGTVTALVNLARLAEVGLLIEDKLGSEYPKQKGLAKPPLIVILQRDSEVKLARASAWGGLILLPIKELSSPSSTGAYDEMARTLIHELGHTSLGRLADEYSGIAQTYQGPEPVAPNVSKNASTAGIKWSKWLSAPSYTLSPPVSTGNVGGYEFDTGVLRPSANCKMKESKKDIAFCPVCTETLTEGILRYLGYKNLQVTAPVVVEMTYLSPWEKLTEEIILPARLGIGEVPVKLPLDVLELTDASDPVPTIVEIKVKRAALPEYKTQLFGRHADGSYDTTSPPNVVYGRPGTLATLEISSGPTSALSKDLKKIKQVVTFSFDNVKKLKLEPPFDLGQSVAVGAIVEPKLDPATGDLSLGLMLNARAGGVKGWTLPTKTEFVLAGPGGTTTLIKTDHAAYGTEHTYVPGGLPHGEYKWSVRTILPPSSNATKFEEMSLGGQKGHFTILPYPKQPESPPVEPFDLAISPRFEVVGLSGGVTPWLRARDVAHAASSGHASSLSRTRGIHLPLGGAAGAHGLSFPPGGYPGQPPVSPGGAPELPRPPHTLPRGIPSEGIPQPFPGHVEKLVDLAASSYDVNGDAVRFEFEVVSSSEAFTGQNLINTVLIKPDGMSTLRVQGVVSIPAGQAVKWRVRAVDEHDNASQWSEAVSPQILPMGILTATHRP